MGGRLGGLRSLRRGGAGRRCNGRSRPRSLPTAGCAGSPADTRVCAAASRRRVAVTAETTSVRHHFAAARVWATERMPYLASALFASELRLRSGSGTVSVDRNWHVLADPETASSLAVPELGSLL